MTAMTVYKVGFWIVSAILILIGAIIIGLLGAGRLSFREEEKVSSAEKLQRQVARFFILTFNDVTNETSDGSLVRTDHRYPEKMQHYVSHIESAVKSHPLPNLLRVDILNLQRENPSVIGVTALLAFDGGSTNESFSETDILDALNNSSITFGLKWVDLHVAEIKGLALPSPTQTGPVPTETKVPSTTDGSKAQPGPAPVVTSGGHCELGIVDYCENVVHHTRVYYPNILGHENPKEVEAALGLFQMLEHQQCHSTIKNFTCLLLQPPCSRGSNSEFKALPPCASYCYDVTSSCQNLLKGTYLEDAATTCNALPLSDCTQVCLPEHFVCKNSHLCLPSSSKCNGRYDCGPNDYSDEQGCGCTDPTKGQCPSGKCIDKSLFCNNQNDCGDWGDQVNCTCPAGYNRCTTTGQCFPERFWCNDEFECADKSDEKNCTCTAADFKCQNGYCLSPEVRCNGINDCDDFSDEFNCECGDHQYRCDKYLCKNYIDTWCNKRPECDDGTDEPANCSKYIYVVFSHCQWRL